MSLSSGCAIIQVAAALLLSAILQPAAAAADYSTSISNAEATGVGITFTSPFDSAPVIGVLPLNIEIKNYTSSDRSWDLTVEAKSWNSARAYTQQNSFAVPAGQVRRFQVYVDLLNQDPNHDSNASGITISATFNGYGLQSKSVTFPSLNAAWDKLRLPLTGFSPALEKSVPDIEAAINAQNSGAFPELDKAYTGSSASLKGYHLAFTNFSLEMLPEKWQGYLSLRQLWITGSEISALTADQREALLGWVFQGGSLYLVIPDSSDPALKQFRIEPAKPEPAKIEFSADDSEITFGLGRVVPVRSSDRQLSSEAFFQNIKSPAPGPALLRGETTPVTSTWGLTSGIGELSAAAGIIILIMVGYGLLVGPVNILVFARNKRHRLFITTPIIATAASILLVVFILLSDGTGGTGNRLIAVLVNPSARLAFTVQEQASRTGLLIDRDFSLPEETVIMPIRYDPTATTSYSSYGSNNDPKALERDKNSYSGEWFESRALNAHVIGTIESSRSGIDLLPEADGRPKILSNFKITIDELYYRDTAGRLWSAENVQPGTEIVLQPEAAESKYETWLQDRLQKSSKAISSVSDSVRGRRGYFYGWSANAESLAHDTVKSVIWRATEAFITGPVGRTSGGSR